MTALTHVTAKDMMQAKVLTLAVDASVLEAIEIFEDERISGAPVVDAGGNLVGVLSLHDIARKEHVLRGRLVTERNDELADVDESERAPWDEPEQYGRDDYSREVLGDQRVADWMNPKVIRVAPEASLKEICRTMAGEGIHRVVVTEGARVVGIISTTDVVRLLANKL
ncbi:MAG: CBS domain-containing protein [Planctomycetes bacterium]|nr:CBS domain-containing protein [Planctomycetota bacterium]